MSDEGYTLVETLLALAMLSLVVTGLSMGLQVLAQWQATTSARVARSQDLRLAQALLERALTTNGPFRSDVPAEFSGDGTGFRYTCGAPEPCEVRQEPIGGAWGVAMSDGRGGVTRVRLHLAAPGEFRFQDGERSLTTWPNPASAGRRRLSAVTLMQGEVPGDSAVLAARAWAEQPADCAFDPALRDCR